VREGYWCNYRQGAWFPIHEHEHWIRGDGNAKKLGLPDALIRTFGSFCLVKDRDIFLLCLMHQAPIMRVRGHGEHISFEFACEDPDAPLREIMGFLDKNAGPCTGVFIRNFAKDKALSASYEQLCQWVAQDGAGSIMGHADTEVLSSDVASELQRRRASCETVDGEVGLFWMSLDGQKFFSRTVPLGEADTYGEFKICDVSHYTAWPQAQQKYAAWREKEYEEVPRGRVVFKLKPGQFILYMPKELGRHEAKLLQKLRIASALAVFDYSDIHYQLNPFQSE